MSLLFHSKPCILKRCHFWIVCFPLSSLNLLIYKYKKEKKTLLYFSFVLSGTLDIYIQRKTAHYFIECYITIYKILYIPGCRRASFQNFAWCNACFSFPVFLSFKNPKKKSSKSKSGSIYQCFKKKYFFLWLKFQYRVSLTKKNYSKL